MICTSRSVRTTPDAGRDRQRWSSGGAPGRIEAIDPEALQRLYQDYGPIVYRRARVLLRDDEEARDAMQEVFVRVASKYDSYRGEKPLLRWIYRITTNLCLNRLRKKRTHPVVADPSTVLRLIDGTPEREDRHAVATVLDAHDDLTQQIVIYYYVDEMSMEEVAETVGYSRKTVSKKLDRFRRRARAMLTDRMVPT